MRALLTISGPIDSLNERIGYLAHWAVLLACLISDSNAMMRYAFDISSHPCLEVQW